MSSPGPWLRPSPGRRGEAAALGAGAWVLPKSLPKSPPLDFDGPVAGAGGPGGALPRAAAGGRASRGPAGAEPTEPSLSSPSLSASSVPSLMLSLRPPLPLLRALRPPALPPPRPAGIRALTGALLRSPIRRNGFS